MRHRIVGVAGDGAVAQPSHKQLAAGVHVVGLPQQVPEIVGDTTQIPMAIAIAYGHPRGIDHASDSRVAVVRHRGDVGVRPSLLGDTNRSRQSIKSNNNLAFIIFCFYCW